MSLVYTTPGGWGALCGVSLAADIGGWQCEVACLEVIGGKKISACLNIPLPLCATSFLHI